MAEPPIDAGMAAGEVLRRYPATLEVFDRHGVVFCAGCFLTLFDPLEDVAGYHAVHDVDALLDDLNTAASAAPGERPAWAQGSAPPPAPAVVGRPLAPEGERRVQEALAGDPGVAAFGIRLLGVRQGSARAGVSVREGGQAHPALAAALVLFAARAADLSLGGEGSAVLDLSLAPLDLSRAGSFLVAEAQREAGGHGGRATAHRVRLIGRGDATVGLATVLFSPGG